VEQAKRSEAVTQGERLERRIKKVLNVVLQKKDASMMQIKMFTIPVFGGEALLDEMNAFMRGHKILQTEKQLAVFGSNACWCFCVSYMDSDYKPTRIKPRIDYKEVLDEQTFKKFSELREVRKRIASEQDIPAYAVFTDEELAELAKMEVVTIEGMKSVKGIGEKKAQKFGVFYRYLHFSDMLIPDRSEKKC